MSVATANPVDINKDNDQPQKKHKTRKALKRITSKIFGKKDKGPAIEASEEPNQATSSSSDPEVSTPSRHNIAGRARSSSSAAAPSSSSSSSSSSPRSSSRQNRTMSTSNFNPTRRASIQGRQNLMAAALPQSGPDRKRAALALLAELEKYDHLQRRSMLRNLPPLQFHITVEKRIDGRIRETEVEVSMEELRTQLKEILRAERHTERHSETTSSSSSSNNNNSSSSSSRPSLRDSGFQIKATKNLGVRDASVFPTHIYDGRPLPDEKNTCTICIEEYAKGDEIKTIPCMHFYHSECVDEWLKRSKLCPVCNGQIELDSPAPETSSKR